MKKLFNYIYGQQKKFWTKQHLTSLFQGFGLLALALLVQKTADAYVGNVAGVGVPDILLDFFPTVDIDFLIVQGALILTIIVFCLLLIKPKYFIFSMKALAIFIISRSFFISLTHLGVSPRQLPLDTGSFGFSLYNWFFNTQGDFFFSGHTGVPYLLALIFWQEKLWRYIFLGFSIIFGVSVILAHIHYSIDVFAAPFMTYSIFIIAKSLFTKDFEFLKQ